MLSKDGLSMMILILAGCCHLSRQDTMLFVATPGGGDSGAGLYGAVISDVGGKTSFDRKYNFKFGYHCMRENGAVKHELDLLSVAYDHVTGYVLLQKAETSPRDLVTLYEGHVCQNGGGCGKRAARVLFERVHFRYKKPRSFAYHDRRIYFLSQDVRHLDTGKTLNLIELRRFAGCGSKYPVTPSSGFEVRRCSEKLATLVNVKSERADVEPMTGLRVVELDGRLYALAVLQELVIVDDRIGSSGHIRDVIVKLYAIRIDDGTVRMLHEERIGQAEYRRYIMKQLGDIDYLDDKLCWSALDRILCADFFSPRERITRVRYIVPPGGASGIVCRGEKIYANITTGVAIADVANDEVSLFFGCLADAAGTGGAGFAHMRHWEFEASPKLRQIRNVTSELYSGQMFLTDKCKYVKHADTESSSYQEYDLQSDQGSAYVHASRSGATIGPVACCLFTITIFGIQLLLGTE